MVLRQLDGGGGLVTESCPTPVTHELYPTRFLCPWDFPGKNTGVGCYFLLQRIFWNRGWTQISSIAGRLFTTEPPGNETTGYPMQKTEAASLYHTMKIKSQ